MGGTKSKKRHRSPTSSVSIPAKDPDPSKKKKSHTTVEVPDNSDESEHVVSNSEAVERAQNSKGHQTTDEQELKKAQRVHANRLSTCYAAFDPPQLSDLLDKTGRRMIAYPCKT
ncbi:hypothetical protein PGTUg99_017923 [Puccinia graminis f. sp. tritici]|uniref:Uncharacterized protein n=1 Tax=Puccinia graminis f. sp. tritici TaxID=56615 RepID=A0A5B0R4K9_PUCGR|nr:hypothetical protein PGTUg99_017923 [Puccinia graminis f. sp. tritici]